MQTLKTVLVTGGTGFIGKKLCYYLVNAGFHVYVFARSVLAPNNSITYITSLDELIEVDIIINLAGSNISKRWSNKIKKCIYDSRITTTRNIINYIKCSKQKPKVLISGSAVGYYGTDLNTTFDEHSEPSGKEGFAKYLCQSWEDEARSAEDLGLRVIYLRIGPVIDKHGGLLSKLLPSFYMGFGGKIGSGMQWISWIDLDDLISLILYIIYNDKIYGPINATSPNPVTNLEFSSKLGKILRRPCIFTIPPLLLKMIFGQMAEEIMLEGQKVTPKKSLEYGFEFNCNQIENSLEKNL